MKKYALSILIIYLLHCQDGAATGEKKIYNALFGSSAGYNTKVRPRLNSTKTVNVYFQLEIAQIQDLDEKSQVLSIVGFITAIWNDEFLTWNPDSYGGIDMIVVPPKDVWLPDVAIDNSADSFYNNDFTTNFRVQLFHTGNISWSFGGVFKTMCQLDNTYFPLDLQNCPIHLTNWAYNSGQVDLHHTKSEVDLQNYQNHGIWNISYSTTAKEFQTYSSHPGEQFPELLFELNLRRKSTYYALNILVPCALIIIVALTVYWLPPDAGEKVSFGVTVLLAFSVFQLVVAEQTPVNSDFSPKLTLLVLSIMGLSSFSVVMSILILRLHHKNTATRVPRWMRVLAFRGVATVLFMRASMPEANEEEFEAKEVRFHDDEAADDNGTRNGKMAAHGELAQLADIAAGLRYITNSLREKEKDNKVLEEWRALGKVIDRFLFWVSLITIVIVASILLGQPDQHFH